MIYSTSRTFCWGSKINFKILDAWEDPREKKPKVTLYELLWLHALRNRLTREERMVKWSSTSAIYCKFCGLWSEWWESWSHLLFMCFHKRIIGNASFLTNTSVVQLEIEILSSIELLLTNKQKLMEATINKLAFTCYIFFFYGENVTMESFIKKFFSSN